VPDTLPVHRREPTWVRWGAPPALVAAAWAVTRLVPFLAEHAPFMLFFLAIVSVSVAFGLGPTLLAIGLSLAMTSLWVLPPLSEVPRDPVQWRLLIAFALTGTVMAWLGDRARRSEARERAQREWNEVTLASVGDAVLVTDGAGRVLFLNRVAEELTGWKRAEARGRPVHEVFAIVNESSRERAEDPTVRVLREGKVVGLANHTLLLRRDGAEIPIDDSGAPIWSEDRRVVGTVLVFRDVTGRREQERTREGLLERLRAAHAEAQAANRAKDEFLGVLSHELRTPLQAIIGWAEVLQGPTLPADEVARAGAAIQRNANRQARLVEDVLDVSRIVSGKLRLATEPVPLRRVIGAAVEMLRPSFEAKGIELSVELEAAPVVIGDEQRLEQTVSNLLSNAVKFTPPGGRVDVACTPAGDDVELCVRDTGCGIRAEFLPHVFDRFRQEKVGTTRDYGGLGLGLAIVRHLVELHGGSVQAESDGPGRGATFRVRLPRATGHVADAADPLPAAAVGLRDLRILAVDDEADARELVHAMLREAGAEIRTAGSVREALAVVSSWRPEVVLTDLEMPGEDGYALLEELRGAGLADVPVVVLSAYASDEHAERMRAAGFAWQAAKPIGRSELCRLVRAAAAREPQA
jgi:PAS domain S-box-containing protein